MMLAQHDIAGLRRLMAAALRRGASAQTICEKLDRAISGLYTPRGGFNKRDLDVAMLVKSIGGPRLLYALQHSHGLASWRTVRRHHKIPQLVPSIGTPTAEEMSQNMEAFLDPDIKPPPTRTANGQLPGNVVMIDGAALNTTCRYCLKRNKILGLCREHSHRVITTVDSLESIEAVRLALSSSDDGVKVCFGSDGTVLAIASYAREDYYTAIPLILSPSCKHETGRALAEWLHVFLDTHATHPMGAAVTGDIWAVATDGDATYRLAKQILCVVQPIDEETPLGRLVTPLLGLNTFTSKDLITCTCDPKHIFKCFATLLRCMHGFMINDVHVTPYDIVDQLVDLPNMTIEKARQLLDPADKQNVPKAVSLLQHLIQLKSLSIHPNPVHNHRQSAIVFVAEMMDCFMQPFINVSMSLSEQIRSLVTYTFLAAAVQVKHGTSCLTGALYADSQATVKNIIITTARMQIMDPLLKFHILHEGTDRLEALFGDCRTQDHSRNFDVEQMAGKLSVATLINATMECNPDLDRGHLSRAVTF